jgi:uncharacterized membrane protein YheB (UPF0754 family)
MTETWGMNPEIVMKSLQTMVQKAVTDKFQKTTKQQVTDKEILLQLKSVKKHGTR